MQQYPDTDVAISVLCAHSYTYINADTHIARTLGRMLTHI